MTLFARCFLLVFCQLGVGGLLSLAIPPFQELERGFYKSSAGVYFFAATMGGLGTLYLGVTRDGSGIGWAEGGLWAATLLLFGLYLASLWGDAMRLRARAYTGALLCGATALAWSGFVIGTGHGIPAGVLAAIVTLFSAATLGAVTTGMLIGHWYLIDPGMEIEPFRRCFRYFVGTVWAEIGVLAIALLALWAVSGAAVDAAVATHGQLLALRLLLGPVAALAMAFLIGRVLAIPQTMAATGLFYIATLAVLVGEFLGRYFTFRTGLPL